MYQVSLYLSKKAGLCLRYKWNFVSLNIGNSSDAIAHVPSPSPAWSLVLITEG